MRARVDVLETAGCYSVVLGADDDAHLSKTRRSCIVRVRMPRLPPCGNVLGGEKLSWRLAKKNRRHFWFFFSYHKTKSLLPFQTYTRAQSTHTRHATDTQQVPGAGAGGGGPYGVPYGRGRGHDCRARGVVVHCTIVVNTTNPNIWQCEGEHYVVDSIRGVVCGGGQDGDHGCRDLRGQRRRRGPRDAQAQAHHDRRGDHPRAEEASGRGSICITGGEGGPNREIFPTSSSSLFTTPTMIPLV